MVFRLLRSFFVWLLRALRPRTPELARPEREREKPADSKRAEPRRLRSGARARTVADATGALRIEYAPRRDGEADPGEIVWTRVPYEDDPSQGKDRPVLVIGYHGRKRVGLALTSKATGRADHVEVGTGSWDPAGRVSYVKLDRLIDLELAPIRREGAVLDRARFDAVTRALRRVGRA